MHQGSLELQLRDGEEIAYGTNLLAADTDDDGLTDSWELRRSGTYPLSPDTDCCRWDAARCRHGSAQFHHLREAPAAAAG